MTTQATERLLNISVEATVDVEQDVLTMSFSAVRQGADAAAVQQEVVELTNKAMDILRPKASGSRFRVVTGAVSISARYDRKQHIEGFDGHTTILVTGTDTAAIAAAAAELDFLTIDGATYSVSPGKRKRYHERLTVEAIEAFRARALTCAKAFGYASYELINGHLNVDSGSRRGRGMARAVTASASYESAASAAPMTEGDKETISATMSGAIQLV